MSALEFRERCFACDRAIHRAKPFEADTRDGQTVYVGVECVKKIVSAGDAGYQPPKGGPRLFPMKTQECICKTECDCEDPEPESGVALCSNECPVHNQLPMAHPDCTAHKPATPPESKP